eukprot:UN12000
MSYIKYNNCNENLQFSIDECLMKICSPTANKNQKSASKEVRCKRSVKVPFLEIILKLSVCQLFSRHYDPSKFVFLQYHIDQERLFTCLKTAIFFSKLNSLENRKIIKLNTHKC